MAEFEHPAHPHAKLMALYAQDAERTPNPERLWQYKKVTGDWGNFSEDDPPFWISCLAYRRHPHADLMLEWEKDQRDNPDQEWQARHQKGPWQRLPHHSPQWSDDWEYRRKPKVRRIGAYEYPEPESKSPSRGTKYWVPSLSLVAKVSENLWQGDALDAHWLANGLVHLTKEAAAAHCEAMLKGWTK